MVLGCREMIPTPNNLSQNSLRHARHWGAMLGKHARRRDRLSRRLHGVQIQAAFTDILRFCSLA